MVLIKQFLDLQCSDIDQRASEYTVEKLQLELKKGTMQSRSRQHKPHMYTSKRKQEQRYNMIRTTRTYPST